MLDQIDRSVAAFQTDLDRRGLTGSTLVATMMMDECYATVAERWFGIDANDVLASKAKPVDGLVND